jgi:hypothetical protein
MGQWVIFSIEHQAWWKAGWLGYTRRLAEAGVYDDEESEAILARANNPAVGRFHEVRIAIELVERQAVAP